MKLVLLGAPGAGKGTQAERISAKWDIPVIGTGNLIREIIKAGTPVGRKAKEYVEKGALVPDDVVIALLSERLTASDCQKGYILDGFPRNVTQAEALGQMGAVIERVIDLEVPDEVILERMSGRRICGGCGASYHLKYNTPRKPGRCDRCGGELTVRADDGLETVWERLRVYHEQTEPLKDYYRALGKLYTVEGQENVEDTTRATFAALEAERV